MNNNRIMTLAWAATLVIVACVAPQRARGQSIADRVRSTGDGKVRFTFAAKPDVCGWGSSINRGGSYRTNWRPEKTEDVEYDSECSHSPVRVVLDVRDSKVTRLRTYVGGRWRSEPAATDLGMMSTRVATDYLLGLASTADGPVARDAIMPATLADSVTIWPALTRIARDQNRTSGSRKQALFWLSAEAGEKVAGSGREDTDEATDIRKQAVFALSQWRNSESVPGLIEVARKNRDPEVRRTALFWLGQKDDPRVIPVFEEILRARE